MIDSNGRYSTGVVGQVFAARSAKASTYVYRSFNAPFNVSYIEYVFREGDRLDVMASKLYGDPKLWAKILDINPEIPNGFHIKPGTIVRIPID